MRSGSHKIRLLATDRYKEAAADAEAKGAALRRSKEERKAGERAMREAVEAARNRLAAVEAQLHEQRYLSAEMARASTRWAQEDLLALIDGAATTERLKGVFGGRVAAPWTPSLATPAPTTSAPTTPAGEHG